jgi:hypothetical protein
VSLNEHGEPVVTLDAEAQTIASMNIRSHPLVNFNAAGSCPSAASKSKNGDRFRKSPYFRDQCVAMRAMTDDNLILQAIEKLMIGRDDELHSTS